MHELRLRRLLSLSILPLLITGCGGADAPDRADDARTPERPTTPLPEGAEAWSYLGGALFPPPLPIEILTDREEALARAIEERDENPDDPEAWIWVGRRQAYLAAYRDAIDTFAEGMERFPGDARFPRHRGHRWITLREFDLARQDLTRATDEMGAAGGEIEPDGLPNAAGIPLTTLAFNAWYHRALAEYLMDDLNAARRSWEATLDVSPNPDLQVATRYWLYLTLRKLGDESAADEVLAGVNPDAEIIENATYRDLLLYFRGDITADDVLPADGEGLGSVTALYGLGAFALARGDEDEARRRFQEILDRADQWAAFGYVAAEMEVARRAW